MFTLMRAITYATIFMGLVFVLLPGQVLRWTGVAAPTHTGAEQIVGATLVILGGVIGVWCTLAFAVLGRGTPAPFDPPRRLVVAGPYRFARNPMYVGAALVLGGAALFYRSIALAGYAAFLAVVVYFLVRGYEEPTLRRLFGAEYEDYCRRVGRWWPKRPTSSRGA